MVMSWIWAGILALSILASFFTDKGGVLAAAIPQGAQAGVTLAISLCGSMCLWTGVGALMEKIGATEKLSQLLSPILCRLFPTFQKDAVFAGSLSSNVCANFLGLGNAATPMGIQAAKRLAIHAGGKATDELCRLIVLNTASIQLIPATVAAVRASLGCTSPFDILLAVWVTSLCSAALGVLAAWGMGKLWKK